MSLLELDETLTERLHAAALITIGGLLYGIAQLVADWLVGLFEATLPLPSTTRLAVSILGFAVLVYVIALHVEEDDDHTLLEKLLGTQEVGPDGTE